MGGEGIDGGLSDASAENRAAAPGEVDEAAVAAAGVTAAVAGLVGAGVEVDYEKGRAARQVIRDRNAVGRRDRDAIRHEGLFKRNLATDGHGFTRIRPSKLEFGLFYPCSSVFIRGRKH